MFPENAEGMVFFDISIGGMHTKAANCGFCIQEKIEEAGGNADEYNARVFLMAYVAFNFLQGNQQFTMGGSRSCRLALDMFGARQH